MDCILIHEVGKRYLFGQSWYSNDKVYHVTEHTLSKSEHELSSHEDLEKRFGPPAICTRCQRKYEGEELSTHASERIVWNTKDGENNHPGDMFFAPWMHSVDGHCMFWDNCNDPRGHLMVVMPDGGIWDTDSRGSNCTMPEDRNHRCWVKHGEAPNVTVDKLGLTCKAGAGSIKMISWHGFLRDGKLVQ